MKVVINVCYGGFSLSEMAIKTLGLESPYADISRTDKNLIALIEACGSEKVSGRYAELEIIEVPNEATDWEIQEYDGLENILYVLNGKIHHIY